MLIIRILVNKLCNRSYETWRFLNNFSEGIHERERLYSAFEVGFGYVVQGTHGREFQKYSFDKVKQFVLKIGVRFLESNKEDVRRCFFCRLLHRWADLLHEDGSCFFLGNFPHCVFQFRWDRRAGDGCPICRWGVSSGGRLERRSRCLT